MTQPNVIVHGSWKLSSITSRVLYGIREIQPGTGRGKMRETLRAGKGAK